MVAELLAQGIQVFGEVEMYTEAATLTDLAAKVKAETFKVMVVGQFKVGKSTFINALLGKDILPAYAIPCTAVINEVKYGAQGFMSGTGKKQELELRQLKRDLRAEAEYVAHISRMLLDTDGLREVLRQLAAEGLETI